MDIYREHSEMDKTQRLEKRASAILEQEEREEWKRIEKLKDRVVQLLSSHV